MRRRTPLLPILSFLFLLLTSLILTLPGSLAAQLSAPSGEGALPGRLRVIATNDFHGNLDPTTPSWADGRQVGGAAVLATYFARARAETDAPTLLLDGGDMMQGTPLSNLTEGRATVAFYNSVGYTAAAIGNHEFDWGVEVLRSRVEQAEFAWLGANIFLKGTELHPDFIAPVEVIVLPGCGAGAPACDSIRVGILGIATRTTPNATLPSHVATFHFEEEWKAIDRWVPRLREGGADFVIVVAHEGAICATPPKGGCTGAMIEIAGQVNFPPDLIVSGHTHAVVDTTVNGIRIVESGSYGAQFTIVDLERARGGAAIVRAVSQPTVWVDEVAPDLMTARILDSYREEVRGNLDEVVAFARDPWLRSGTEYPLGNLIADAQRRATGAEVAIMNNGGIRTEIGVGPITYEELFRVQPFGNTLTVLTLTGDRIEAAVRHALTGGRTAGHFSGLTTRFRRTAEGIEIVELLLEDGTPVDPDGNYRVVVNNFLAEGGDGYTMLLDPISVEETDLVDIDALITHLSELGDPLPRPSGPRLVEIPRGG